MIKFGFKTNFVTRNEIIITGAVVDNNGKYNFTIDDIDYMTYATTREVVCNEFDLINFICQYWGYLNEDFVAVKHKGNKLHLVFMSDDVNSDIDCNSPEYDDYEFFEITQDNTDFMHYMWHMMHDWLNNNGAYDNFKDVVIDTLTSGVFDLSVEYQEGYTEPEEVGEETVDLINDVFNFTGYDASEINSDEVEDEEYHDVSMATNDVSLDSFTTPLGKLLAIGVGETEVSREDMRKNVNELLNSVVKTATKVTDDPDLDKLYRQWMGRKD